MWICQISDLPKIVGFWQRSNSNSNTSLLGGLLLLCKFGWNQCSSCDNMEFLILCTFGLKTPIHAHKIWVLGDMTPKWVQYQRNPQKAHPWAERRLAIHRNHPCHWIEKPFGMAGCPQVVVISFKFHQNSLCGVLSYKPQFAQNFIMSYSLLKCSGMECVNERSQSFTCHPHIYPQVEWTIPPHKSPQPQSIITIWLVLISHPAENRSLTWRKISVSTSRNGNRVESWVKIGKL